MKLPKINWTMVLAVVIGLVIFYVGKKMLFAEVVDEDSLEVTSNFRGWRDGSYMHRVA